MEASGRFLSLQKRMEELRQEFKIIKELSDEEAQIKHDSARKIHKELFHLQCKLDVQKLKEALRHEVDALRNVQHIPSVSKKTF